jgi:hypothetical protein
VREHPKAAFDQTRVVGADTHQLRRKVALDRERDVARTAGIDAPAAVFVLIAHHFSARAGEAAWVAALKQRVEKDVIGLEHRIAFELAAPVTFRMLLGEKKLARLMDSGPNVSQVCIHASELRGGVLRTFRLNSHAVEMPHYPSEIPDEQGSEDCLEWGTLVW